MCEDDCQYVGWEGQQWTTREALGEKFQQRVEEDDGPLTLGVTPFFAIDQRELLLPTDAGNILWETVSLVTDEAVDAINKRGGREAVEASYDRYLAAVTG